MLVGRVSQELPEKSSDEALGLLHFVDFNNSCEEKKKMKIHLVFRYVLASCVRCETTI